MEDESKGGAGRMKEDGEEPGMGGPSTATEKLLETKEVLEGILTRMGVGAKVQVRDTAEAIVGRLDLTSGQEIFENAPGGQVLDALQFLVNRIVNRDPDERKWLVLTLGEELEDREKAMAEMAHRLAATAKRMEMPLTVVGMEARQRKTVHLALAEEEGIRTRSEGDGVLRRIVVESKGSSGNEQAED